MEVCFLIQKLLFQNKYIEKLVPLYRPATQKELKLCPGNWKYGSFFTTLVTECALFLPWASDKFIQAGGKIKKYKIQSFSTLWPEYKVVVNCCGLGAKILCDDSKIVPIRGQVLKVNL